MAKDNDEKTRRDALDDGHGQRPLVVFCATDDEPLGRGRGGRDLRFANENHRNEKKKKKKKKKKKDHRV